MKCQACPIAGNCFGERAAYACQWARDDAPPSQRQSLAALSAGDDAPPPTYPPLATQARNIAESLRDWLRAGLPITPRSERERRRAACLACPLFDASRRRCTACGCFGGIKPWLATATCPEGKWDA